MKEMAETGDARFGVPHSSPSRAGPRPHGRWGLALPTWLSRWLGSVSETPTIAPPDGASLGSEPPKEAATKELVSPPSFLERVAELLNLPLPEPEAAEFDDPQVVEIAERVMIHFDEHRPGPDAFPSLSLRVINLVAEPNVRASDLAQLISRDPALSAAILKVANSGVYARDFEARSVRDAIVRMGLDEVARTAGALAARTLFNPRTRSENALMGARWAALFSEATVTAIQASAVALRLPGAHSDQAFLGGLLHDVGKTIGLRSLSSLMVDGVVSSQTSDRVVESVLDRVHVLIGAEVHQDWRLPQYLTELCVRHHDREVPLSDDTIDLHVVRMVSGLHLWRSHPLRHPTAAHELVQSAELLGYDERQLRSIAADLRQVKHNLLVTL